MKKILLILNLLILSTCASLSLTAEEDDREREARENYQRVSWGG